MTFFCYTTFTAQCCDRQQLEHHGNIPNMTEKQGLNFGSNFPCQDFKNLMTEKMNQKSELNSTTTKMK